MSTLSRGPYVDICGESQSCFSRGKFRAIAQSGLLQPQYCFEREGGWGRRSAALYTTSLEEDTLWRDWLHIKYQRGHFYYRARKTLKNKYIFVHKVTLTHRCKREKTRGVLYYYSVVLQYKVVSHFLKQYSCELRCGQSLWTFELRYFVIFEFEQISTYIDCSLNFR